MSPLPHEGPAYWPRLYGGRTFWIQGTTSLTNILYFRSLDEPDADYDTYKEHI